MEQVTQELYLIQLRYNNQTWLSVLPRYTQEEAIEQMKTGGQELFNRPPREIRFGDAMPDDVQICIGGHCASLGWLREVLKQA